MNELKGIHLAIDPQADGSIVLTPDPQENSAETLAEFAKGLFRAMRLDEIQAAREAAAEGAIVIAPRPGPVPESLDEWPDVRWSSPTPARFDQIAAYIDGMVECFGAETGHLVLRGHRFTAFCDEDGRGKGLPFNPMGSAFTGRVICGPVWILTDHAEEADRTGEGYPEA